MTLYKLICEFCGEDVFYDAIDIFDSSWDTDRGYILDTCCEMRQNIADDSNHYDVMSQYVYTRSVVDGVIDLGISIGTVKQTVAKEFISNHHRHNNPPPGWKFGIGCYNGGDLIGVAMVGRPVARMIDHTMTLEVNRLCINHELPYNLYMHASSMMYASAARKARKLGYKEIITYILDSEPGTSLIAAGWAINGHVKGRSWNTLSRVRRALPTDGINKIKYHRIFNNKK